MFASVKRAGSPSRHPDAQPHTWSRAIPVLLTAAVMFSCGNDDGGNVDEVDPFALHWVSVEGGRFVDALGRELQLRGINARVDGLFDVTFDDGRIALEPIPTFDASDAEAMARHGFNWLRLPINWSGLEPVEGQLNEAYLERLDEVIALANDAGLYVMVDFHQDAYSKQIGEDGAPLWAIVPTPTADQLLEGPLVDLEERRLSPIVFDAFRAFFENDENLQQRFLPAWQSVVGRYPDEPGVIGFEPFNEPVLLHFDADELSLHAFYRLIIASAREVNPRHPLWLEPGARRNFFFESPVPSESFGDSQIVYAPHLYPNFAGVSRDTQESWRGFLDNTHDALAEEATAWGTNAGPAAMAWGEWGMDPRSEEAQVYFPVVQAMSAERGIAQALWLWKEDSQDSWGIFDFDESTQAWTPRQSSLALVESPYAAAVPGRLLTHTYDDDTRTLTVTFEASGGEGPPVLYLPERVYGDGAAVTINTADTTTERDGAMQREVVGWDGEAGTFELRVTPR
ncbi:MAG: endoglycosylceramidase [Bradymonadia bacterium]|jgi:endoglycosylceramidase